MTGWPDDVRDRARRRGVDAVRRATSSAPPSTAAPCSTTRSRPSARSRTRSSLVIAPDAAPPPVPPAPGAPGDGDARRRRPPRTARRARGGPRALADIDRGYDAAAVVVGGDMPHLVPAVLELLAAAVDADPAAGAATLEVDPPCVLPLAVRPSIAGPVVDALLARRSPRAPRAPRPVDRGSGPGGDLAGARSRRTDPRRRRHPGRPRATDVSPRGRQDARPWEGGRASCWR